MLKTKLGIVFFSCAFLFLIFVHCTDEEIPAYSRNDAASKLGIPLTGSLQNPAFSPDGRAIVFTRFRDGYNTGPADIFVYHLDTYSVDTLVMDGSTNVNLPGACWNPQNQSIVFSSSRGDHDEIFMIAANGKPGEETRVTSRPAFMAYEPSFSPDGQWIVFESHPVDVEGQGVITKYDILGATYLPLTGTADDCRQPNWSPAGNLLLCQKFAGGQWDIWTMAIDGTTPVRVTSGAGDKTDASFSGNGTLIYYSSDAGLEYANIYKIPAGGGTPVRVTVCTGYDGAPAVSPDGMKLAFESCRGDPDGSPGTSIWILDISN